MVTLYNVISQDWFIARPDGSEDFIPDELWSSTLEIYKKFEVLVMGRKTYETIQSYPEEMIRSFEDLKIKKVVISHDANYQTKAGYQVMTVPEEAIALSPATLVSSGPTLNNYLLGKSLVESAIFHEIPTAIHEGIPVFDAQYRKSMTLVSSRDVGIGQELIYRV